MSDQFGPPIQSEISLMWGWGWHSARETDKKLAKAIVELWKEIARDREGMLTVKTYVRAASIRGNKFAEYLDRLEKMQLVRRLDVPFHAALRRTGLPSSFSGDLADIGEDDLLRIKPSQLLCAALKCSDAEYAEYLSRSSELKPSSLDEIKSIVRGGAVAKNLDLSALPEDALAWFGECTGLVCSRNVRFEARGESDLREFVIPASMRVIGMLDIDCRFLDAQVKELDVGALRIARATVHSWPLKLRVRRHAWLDRVDAQCTSKCRSIRIGGGFWIGESKIDRLPPSLAVGNDLRLKGTFIREIGWGARIGGSFEMTGGGVDRMPVGMSVGGHMMVYVCRLRLPECLRVRQHIDIHDSTVEIPASARSRGLCIVRSDVVLPVGYEIVGDLTLRNPSREMRLPARLTIRGNLRYETSDRIPKPDRLKLEGSFIGNGWIDSIEKWERQSALERVKEDVNNKLVQELLAEARDRVVVENEILAPRREILNGLADAINDLAVFARDRGLAAGTDDVKAAMASAFRHTHAAACNEWNRLNEIQPDELAAFDPDYLRKTVAELRVLVFSPIARSWMEDARFDGPRVEAAPTASGGSMRILLVAFAGSFAGAVFAALLRMV